MKKKFKINKNFFYLYFIFFFLVNIQAAKFYY